MKKTLFMFFYIFLLASCGNSNIKLQQGDLVFQNLDCGELCDAIEKVTTGINGLKFSHVAIVSRIGNNGEIYVIEAYDGVKEISLSELLKRSDNSNKYTKTIFARMTPEYQYMIPIAVKKAYALIGKKYDPVFKLNNDSYYCSELIYEIFKRDDSGNEVEVFPLNTMTFKDPDTGQITDVWNRYFKKFGVKPPEGELGINPGAISRSDKLKILN